MVTETVGGLSGCMMCLLIKLQCCEHDKEIVVVYLWGFPYGPRQDQLMGRKTARNFFFFFLNTHTRTDVKIHSDQQCLVLGNRVDYINTKQFFFF